MKRLFCLLIFFSLNVRAAEIRRAQPLMGTIANITLMGINEEKLHADATQAFAIMRSVEARLSAHKKESEINRVNIPSVAKAIEPLSSATIADICKSILIAKETDGAFDPTIAPLVHLWGFLWKTKYRHPTAAEIETKLPLVDYKRLQPQYAKLSETKNSNCSDAKGFGFEREGMKIDLGGIGKGIAVDAAVAWLKSQKNINFGLVKISGDTYCFGEKSCVVHIQHPRKKDAILGTVSLKDAALSVSGDYENFFWHQGKRFSHILDPKTGKPVSGIPTLVIIANTATVADALATAGTVLLDRGQKIPRELYLHKLIVRERDQKLILSSSDHFPWNKSAKESI